MGSNFWAKKLSGDRPAAPPRPAPVNQNYLPRGVGIDHDAAIDHYMGRDAQPRQFEVQEEPQYQQDGTLPMAQGVPTVFDRRGMLKTPSKGVHAGDDHCPSCGSGRFMIPTNARQTGAGGVSVRPAGYCADCGFNERFGEHDTPGLGVKTVGGAKVARAGESMKWSPQPQAKVM